MEKMFIIPQRCCYGGNTLSIPGILFIFYLPALSANRYNFIGDNTKFREKSLSISTHMNKSVVFPPHNISEINVIQKWEN